MMRSGDTKDDLNPKAQILLSQYFTWPFGHGWLKPIDTKPGPAIDTEKVRFSTPKIILVTL
jgi:hypothetical protein